MAHTARDGAEGRGALVSVAQAAALLGGAHPTRSSLLEPRGRTPAYRTERRGDRRYRSGDVQRLLAEGTGSDQPGFRNIVQTPKLRSWLGSPVPGSSANATAVCRTAVEALRSHLRIARDAAYLVPEGGDGVLQLETHAGYQVSPPDTLDPGGADQIEEGSPIADIVVGPLRRQLVLRAGGEIVGAMVLEDDPDGPLATVALAFLRTVATAVAANVITARALGRAKRELSRSRALRHVTQELTGQLDLAAVLDDIVDRTRILFDAEKAGLWLLEDGRVPFSRAAARGLGDEFLRPRDSLTWDNAAVGVQATRERRSIRGPRSATRGRRGRDAGDVCGRGDQDRLPGAAGQSTTARWACWACTTRAITSGRRTSWRWRSRSPTRRRSPSATRGCIGPWPTRPPAFAPSRTCRRRLNRLTDVQAIADAIVAEASTLAAYHDIRVYTVNWERRASASPSPSPTGCSARATSREPSGSTIGEGSFTGWVAEHGEPILVQRRAERHARAHHRGDR